MHCPSANCNLAEVSSIICYKVTYTGAITSMRHASYMVSQGSRLTHYQSSKPLFILNFHPFFDPFYASMQVLARLLRLRLQETDVNLRDETQIAM